MSLFVLGTGTEVGKTVVSAALLWRYCALRPRYWKPVATGASEGRDVDTVRELSGGEVEVLSEEYLFADPLSPHLAARREGRTIELANVLAAFDRHTETEPRTALLVEGVGGLLVPLTDGGFLLAGLCSALALPCVVVARSTVGTINHTLLTLEAARARGLDVVGVLLNGPPNRDNRDAIERFGQVEVLGELPHFAEISPARLREAALKLDPEERLAGLLRG